MKAVENCYLSKNMTAVEIMLSVKSSRARLDLSSHSLASSKAGLLFDSVNYQFTFYIKNHGSCQTYATCQIMAAVNNKSLAWPFWANTLDNSKAILSVNSLDYEFTFYKNLCCRSFLWSDYTYVLLFSIEAAKS